MDNIKIATYILFNTPGTSSTLLYNIHFTSVRSIHPHSLQNKKKSTPKFAIKSNQLLNPIRTLKLCQKINFWRYLSQNFNSFSNEIQLLLLLHLPPRYFFSEIYRKTKFINLCNKSDKITIIVP